MVKSRIDYAERGVQAALQVLVEMSRLLNHYAGHFAIVGGFVPYLALSNAEQPHVGSLDVDIALDHREIHEEAYRTIRDTLIEHGYREGKQPFMFFKEVLIKDIGYEVEVDFLAGEYEGRSRSHRHQNVQDLKARKARGCDLVFLINNEIEIAGEHPGGGKDTVTVRVPKIPIFLTMKGMAFSDRKSAKDAYDIYYCCRYYPGGLDALIAASKPHSNNTLVKEGLMKIANTFASPEHIGPKLVADFLDPVDGAERAMIQRDAFERINYFLKGLGYQT